MDAHLFLYLVIGQLVAYRTVDLLKLANIVAVENEKWLRSLYLVAPIMLFLLKTIEHTQMFWVIALVCFGLPFLIAEVVGRRRTRHFVSETTAFYDELVFELRSGNSLRSSLDRIANGSQFGFYTCETAMVALKNSEESVANRNKMTDQRVRELQKLLKASGKVLDRLQFLRHTHRLEQKFRRRSRIATSQVRAQALIVVLLYVGLLILQISTGFTQLSSPFVWVSLGLISVGLAGFSLVSRSFRWKV